MITIEDFMKVELVVGRVVEAREHLNADKLLVLKVDIAEEELRQVVAGIRKAYDPATLIGKQIIVVKNLAPVTLRGEESQGMLLAVSGENGPVVLSPEKEVPVGTRVK